MSQTPQMRQPVRNEREDRLLCVDEPNGTLKHAGEQTQLI